MRKHTPSEQRSAASCPSLPLVNQVLTFFEPLVAHSLPRSQRGAPEKLPVAHLLLACILGLFEGVRGPTDLWRLILLRPIGSFAAVQITDRAVRQRLLSLKLTPFARLLEQVNTALQQRPALPWASQLAPFASQIVCLDETTLDRVARLCDGLTHLSVSSPLLLAGKLAGLFDLRTQQWVHLQLRRDGLAHCKTGVLLLIEGLPAGSLILADLGYFSFLWFDALTDMGYWWVSRVKPRASYQIHQVLYECGETLDALVWLGAYRSDHAAHAARLIQFRFDGLLYQYFTNVTDPRMLSMAEVAQLYARRWDIERAFAVLKEQLGLNLWWGCDPTLLIQQIYLTVTVAQVLHRLQLEIAAQAQVDPYDVSISTLLLLLRKADWSCHDGLVPTLLQHGRAVHLIRPNSRIKVQAPQPDLRDYTPIPPDLVLLRPRKHTMNSTVRHPRSFSAFDFRLTTLLLL